MWAQGLGPRGPGQCRAERWGQLCTGPLRSSLLAPVKPRPPARYSERLAPHSPWLEGSCVLTWEQGQQEA